MASIGGIALGTYLFKKKKYKTIFIMDLFLVALGLFMLISGIIEKSTYERFQTEGVIVTAICYSNEREPMSGKKYAKRSYWEWEYNGKYYGKEVGQTEAEKQLAEIGKTCNVYIDPKNPYNYILVTEYYNPNGTMIIGMAVTTVFGLITLMTILSIRKIKEQDQKV